MRAFIKQTVSYQEDNKSSVHADVLHAGLKLQLQGAGWSEFPEQSHDRLYCSRCKQLQVTGQLLYVALCLACVHLHLISMSALQLLLLRIAPGTQNSLCMYPAHHELESGKSNTVAQFCCCCCMLLLLLLLLLLL